MKFYHLNFRDDQYTINIRISQQLRTISEEFANMDQQIAHVYYDLEFQTIGKNSASNFNGND